jgi:hypothetical protein
MSAFSSPTTPTGTESPSCHFQDSAVCVLSHSDYAARQPVTTEPLTQGEKR